MSIKFKIIKLKSLEYYAALDLRHEVLVKQAGLDKAIDTPDTEIAHTHVAGLDGNALCATAMLVGMGVWLKIQRVAVHDNYRNKGVGSAMMAFCEKVALDEGYSGVYVHARDLAVSFYRQNDYKSVGDYFEEDTIQHIKMVKDL